MRRPIPTIVSIGVVLLASLLYWSSKVLDMISTIQTAFSLPDVSDSVVGFIARYPGLTTDVLPALLGVSGLASLALIHVWPNAVHDLIGRKRLVCDFDQNIAGCVSDGVALPSFSGTTTTSPGTSYIIRSPGFPVPTATTSAIRLTGDFVVIGERRRYFRLCVKAAKRYEIKRCAAALINVQSDDGSAVYDGGPIALTIAPAERADPEHKDIEVGREEFVDVVYVTEMGEIGIGSRYAPHSISWAEAFSKPGVFRLKVIVNAADCQPVERTISLDWTGNWQTTSARQVDSS